MVFEQRIYKDTAHSNLTSTYGSNSLVDDEVDNEGLPREMMVYSSDKYLYSLANPISYIVSPHSLWASRLKGFDIQETSSNDRSSIASGVYADDTEEYKLLSLSCYHHALLYIESSIQESKSCGWISYTELGHVLNAGPGLLLQAVESTPLVMTDVLYNRWLEYRVQSRYSKIFSTEAVEMSIHACDISDDTYALMTDSIKTSITNGLVKVSMATQITEALILAYEYLGDNVTSDTMFDQDWSSYSFYTNKLFSIYRNFEIPKLSDLLLHNIHIWIDTRDVSDLMQGCDDIQQITSTAIGMRSRIQTDWNTLLVYTEGYERTYDINLVKRIVEILKAMSMTMIHLSVEECYVN
ncbi:hypothetical protein HDU86_007572 [Geranomyces michiganensis]|nr:hypothetical protein HDU86_007572 [Geranomyces michiganensis]